MLVLKDYGGKESYHFVDLELGTEIFLTKRRQQEKRSVNSELRD